MIVAMRRCGGNDVAREFRIAALKRSRARLMLRLAVPRIERNRLRERRSASSSSIELRQRQATVESQLEALQPSACARSSACKASSARSSRFSIEPRLWCAWTCRGASAIARR